VGQLFAQASSYTHPPLMPPRTHVLVTCSEIERANHSWEVFWDPPRLYLVSEVLFWGPQIVRALSALHSVPMLCLLSVAFPEGFTFCCSRSVYFMYYLGAGCLCCVDTPSHTFGPLSFHSHRRKPLGPSPEVGRLRSG